MTNFWASDVMTGIWTSSFNSPGNSGGVGLTLRDGYMVGTLGVTGMKAFKHTSGLVGASISTVNVQFEFFDEPNDVPIASGEMTNVWGDLYIGGNITGTNSLSTNGPISGGSLSVTGSVSSGGDISGANLTVGGDVTTLTVSPYVHESDGYACGGTAACPCSAATPGVWGGTTYPAPGSPSFWASIYRGTTLHPGANTFRYYTGHNITQNYVMPDVFFTFHPTQTANIGQVFQMSGTNTKDIPYGYWIQTYDVSIFVNEEVTLSSDFVFFLEANQTKSMSTPGSCLYPPA
jgi:hypothetical protein